jgi:acetyltransferase-like isoleucine patch superfamily enzyme
MHGLPDLSDIEVLPLMRSLSSRGPILICDKVWNGEGVCILPGVTASKNSIIGANAMVTRDIPLYTIAGGVPAKIINTIPH